ncbi:MAG TPA: protein kinase [Verrucomicrobiae bacterium]
MSGEPGSSETPGSTVPEAGIGPIIPDHTLLRPIARGSYGEVWIARCALGSLRAVKIVRRGNFREARPYERELAGIRNYEPVSREHEGLVDVLQVGSSEPEGFFYYVMELADDIADSGGATSRSANGPASESTHAPHTLALELASRAPLPVAEVVEAGLRLARALEFLHSRGLVHRDVKPSNIIFIGGQPKLADVGTVAELGDSLSYVGTLGYMPPEGPGSVQADIYSLGKILYEAATGKDRQEFPDLPAQLAAQADASALLELNEVLVKACDTDPSQRYQSAAEMIEDLELLRDGRSLRQARTHRRRLRRLKAAALVALGLGAMAGTVWVVGFANGRRTVARPKILFSGDFDSPRLNTNVWGWGTTNWPSKFRAGERELSVDVANGELVIQGKAQHKEGYTTRGAAWVDLKTDLRQYGECQVEIELAGTNRHGWSVITVSDGNPPRERLDSHCVLLLSMPPLGESGPPDVAVPLSHTRVRVDLLPRHRAAIVYPDASVPEKYEIADLTSLQAWHLRLLADVYSSLGWERSFADLRLRKIEVKARPPGEVVIGSVVIERTGQPLPEASVMAIAGHREMRLATTRENGAFKLIPDAWPVRLQVRHEDFLPSDAQTISRDDVRAGPVTFKLRKRIVGFGDVVEVISLADASEIAFGFVTSGLWVMDHAGPSDSRIMLLRQFDLRTRNLSQPVARFLLRDELQGFSALASCQDRLLLTSVHPGAVYELHPSKATYSLLGQPKTTEGRHINRPTHCAFDGQLLWLLENDPASTNYGLHALDLSSLTARLSLPTRDTGLSGLAWDPDRQQFWVATTAGGGRVYAVDREVAIREGRLEPGRGREFKGNYRALAYGDGHLWALPHGNRVWKIKLAD